MKFAVDQQLIDNLCWEAVRYHRAHDALRNDPDASSTQLDYTGRIIGLRIALCHIHGWDPQEVDRGGKADELIMDWWRRTYPGDRDLEGHGVMNRTLLIDLLRDMDRWQQESASSGGREIAWYAYRASIENALGLEPGTLDTPPPDRTDESADDRLLRQVRTNLLEAEQQLRHTAFLLGQINKPADAAACTDLMRTVEAACGEARNLRAGCPPPSA